MNYTRHRREKKFNNNAPTKPEQSLAYHIRRKNIRKDNNDAQGHR